MGRYPKPKVSTSCEAWRDAWMHGLNVEQAQAVDRLDRLLVKAWYDAALEERRDWIVLNWAAGVLAPAWLATAGFADAARSLRVLDDAGRKTMGPLRDCLKAALMLVEARLDGMAGVNLSAEVLPYDARREATDGCAAMARLCGLYSARDASRSSDLRAIGVPWDSTWALIWGVAWGAMRCIALQRDVVMAGHATANLAAQELLFPTANAMFRSAFETYRRILHVGGAA